jgi:putative peptidoglycan lipid II flippase
MPGMVRSAMRMMAGTLTSRLLGLLREILTASYFGATRSLDAYYAAYTLANLSRQLLAEGALSASFVPTFSRVYDKSGTGPAARLARQVMSVLMALCTAVVALGMLCSPLLVRIIAPGFGAEQSAMAASLTRALFPFLLIVSLGALAMGVLNSVGSFFVPAVAPAASNLAFIVILIVFRRNISVWTMVAAVLVGGLSSMTLQWAMSWKMGCLLIPAKPDISDPDLRGIAALFLPYAAGLSLNQVNPLVSRMLGSYLDAGIISVLNYSDRIIQLPLGLFVIAISQAVLPMLSRIDRDDNSGFRLFIRDALRFNLFMVLPASIAMMRLAGPIVHILLVRGAFGEWAWKATSGALACYAAGLPGMACGTIIMRALYARGMAKAAVKVTLFTVCANLSMGALLMRNFSHLGLAAGTSCAFTASAFLGAWMLSRDMGMKIMLADAPWMTRLLCSCGIMGIAVYLGMNAAPYPAAAPLTARALWTAAAAAAGCGLYAALTAVLRCPEWNWIKTAARRGCKHS